MRSSSSVGAITSPFQTSILLDGLSGSLGAPQTATRPELAYPIEKPIKRLLEGLALLELHRLGESVRVFNDAVAAANEMLALADRNVAALRARALALSGLAAATGDPARAAEAAEAFARAKAVTSAAGLAADTRLLLGKLG